MHVYYQDILSKINEKPQWFDEHTVPRFCKFEPDKCADVYAKEVLLMEIECQNCRYKFNVCYSWHHYLKDIVAGKEPFPLSKYIELYKDVPFGDPPNIWCCDSGPTMSSNEIKILEFWKKDSKLLWMRIPELEIEFNNLD